MKHKRPPPIRPTHIERQGKTIRDIDRKRVDLRERLEHTTDPESAGHLEDKLRTLDTDRNAPLAALADWFERLPESERTKHEDFVRRCGVGQPHAPVSDDSAAVR
jgi:hypothetical protein